MVRWLRNGDFELVGMGVGHQLNAKPPFATQILRRKDKKRFRQKDYPHFSPAE